MRFFGIAMVTGAALVFGACGGGGDQAAEATAEAPAAEAPAMEAPAAEAPAAAQAVTGTMHTVNMIGDEQGYRFEPADITIKAGDGIKFVMVSGGPHNVAFDPTLLPEGVKSTLTANMPNQMTELAGPMMLNPNEEYTVSFAGVAPGTYEYFCTPHLAMGMKGNITVTE
jgi:plastocyanin